jgi:hypothetical protein
VGKVEVGDEGGLGAEAAEQRSKTTRRSGEERGHPNFESGGFAARSVWSLRPSRARFCGISCFFLGRFAFPVLLFLSNGQKGTVSSIFNSPQQRCHHCYMCVRILGPTKLFSVVQFQT